MTTQFDGMILEVPEFWERSDEWQKVYSEADSAEKPLIKTQGRLADLLEELDGAAATPVNIAWLSLWGRIFQCCDGARGAYMRQSLYTLTILRRVVFETSLHLGAILQPLIEAQDEHTDRCWPGGRNKRSRGNGINST